MNRWQCTARALADIGAAGVVVHPLWSFSPSTIPQNTRLTFVCSRLPIATEQGKLRRSFCHDKHTAVDIKHGTPWWGRARDADD